MQIKKIQVHNFRLLKDVSIDLERDLSLIIGKNNCGKTSLLLILDKFLGGNSTINFSFDDFNTDFKDELKSKIESDEELKNPFPFLGISLKLFIEYDENDDLSNIGNKVLMDLSLDNRTVVLAFEYALNEERFYLLRKDFKALCEKRAFEKKEERDIFTFLKEQQAYYFKVSKKSVEYSTTLKKENDDIYTDLIKEKIQIDKIISFKWISARRNVSNKDSDKALSSLSSKIYKKLEAGNVNPDTVEKFKEALSEADKELNVVYSNLFKEVIGEVKKFGGIRQDDSIIKIVSSLQHRELLEENTTVMYGLNNADHSLPENYNGLGYLNLISMIFEIQILLHEFQKAEDQKPSDINLLFIEEPEAHTHPQMQYIFIKNIKSLLKNGIKREDGLNRRLQTILSTHSSHIVSEGDFSDIKYFKKEDNSIVSKNLNDLEKEYATDGYEQHYKFLKQYLTVHRSELFFADKAIFIEGDTERVLLSAMMKKIDQEDSIEEQKSGTPEITPLLSQNISIVEVGAYSQVFEKFIDFIGIKSLIITDIDSVRAVPKKDKEGKTEKNADGTDKMKMETCLVSIGENTSNHSLKFFFGGNKTLSDLTALQLEKKIFRKDRVFNEWSQNKGGHLLCVYQTKEENCERKEYHARSFEDSFFHINENLIAAKSIDKSGNFIDENPFTGLTQSHLREFLTSHDPYQLANNGLKSKPTFAIEVLLNSECREVEFKAKETGESKKAVLEFSNWNIPAYIQEGLHWLKM